ncbi:NB-ARC domain-containing protein [Actinophytocola oryzae]|uniref:NB-ARC domain-containing protein n=1 Tax=Actinophytocola oryzae TaxID=502181 RepID=A0A4R7UZ04_9PSEU|nr:NB-ARC domain-containing protein [Actinophytocola oryzae]TDV42139.1 NB-ARC domain-containing protein [Actinophytocola oryzae]
MDREQHRNVFIGISSGSIVQARDVHVHNTVAYPTPYQLPPDQAAFVGRSEHLEQLDDLASRNQETARTAVITGQPGVGKTALAVHWGHRAREQYPDGQLYVDLRGYDATGDPARWENVLEAFLQALGGPQLVIPASREAQKGLYHSMTSERRVLAILDNAASTDQVRSLIPPGARCLTLVTSRKGLPGLVARDGARRLTLDPLPTEHAVTFLTSIVAEHRIPEATMAQLAELCAGLPLALRIAAEHAANPGTRIERYIQELSDEQSRLDALDFSDDDTSTAVRAIFSWSYRALPHVPAPWSVTCHQHQSGHGGSARRRRRVSSAEGLVPACRRAPG